MKKTGNQGLSRLALILLSGLNGCGGSGEPSTPARPEPTASSLLAETIIESWTKCAEEWQTCSFAGTTQVRYGLNGTYATRTATSSIGCNNNVFGDPLPG